MALTRLGPNQSVNLASNVTGTLPVANGGTALTSGFVNGVANPGKIGQVVQALDSTVQSYTSNTLTQASPTASITPTATSSKVLAIFNAPLLMSNTATSYAEARMYRDTTELRLFHDMMIHIAGSPLYTATQTLHFEYLDSPNTTSSITYSMKVAEHGSSTFYFNNSSGSGGNGTSSMTLMEILA